MERIKICTYTDDGFGAPPSPHVMTNASDYMKMTRPLKKFFLAK